MRLPATAIRIRALREGDYEPVVAALGQWWGADRALVRMLPRLFFRHFAATSLAAESAFEFEPGAAPAGLLVGIVSDSVPGEAHAHFVGVAPWLRGQGVGRALYLRFFELAAARGCVRVTAATTPSDTDSQAFHTRMGFRQLPVPGGLPTARQVWKDWDGPGEDRVRYVRDLVSTAATAAR